MEKITTVGIDLAKNVFSIHGVDQRGHVVLKKTLSRARLLETVAQWPGCTIGMEACTGAHDWARRFEALGHTVRLMAPKFVAPYRKSGKNDGNDAEALPQLARQVIDELLEHLRLLDARIEDYERRLGAIASHSEAARRLMQLSGIGAITASAVVATVGEAKLFDSGRQFAAWLGRTPRQYSTGGKTRLGHITRRGDRYLRTLFIMVARSVLQTAPRHDDRRSRWAMSVRERCGYHKAVVAIAAKNAPIAWAPLAKGQPLFLPS